MQAKLLAKELDLVKTAQQKNSEEFEQVENNHRSLEKKLKEKDWELQDMKAMKDARYKINLQIKTMEKYVLE